MAIDELIALQDLESHPQMQKVVSELQSGCAPDRSDASISELAFPWLTLADVEYLEAKVSELAKPLENP